MTQTVSARHTTPGMWLVGVLTVLGTVIAGVCIGAVHIAPIDALAVIANHIPGVHCATSASASDSAIIWDLRFPRIVLALLVGAMLATSGCSYQGTFRNPLADPYLLGVSAGAGLGATTCIVLTSNHNVHWLLPLAAFIGAMIAVALTYSLGRSALVGRSATSLVLAGVAVASMLTAIQTLIQQRNSDKIREVYGWILGRLSTSGWTDVELVAPYIVICIAVLFQYRRVLDVFAVGDEEALTMGLPVARARAAIIIAASLGTAAAVSVTGLIGFVGIIVPHSLRLLMGNSYRRLLPQTAIFGGVFLVCADIIARTALAPQEIPIGVVTALIGAPFFLLVLGSSRHGDLT